MSEQFIVIIIIIIIIIILLLYWSFSFISVHDWKKLITIAFVVLECPFSTVFALLFLYIYCLFGI